METSILKSTKKILGISPEYTAFDLDIITHINSVFSTLFQLGIGPDGGFSIDDDQPKWEDYLVPAHQLQMIRSYVFLKVRLYFDPPTTSYLIENMSKQVNEFEWRLNVFREDELPEEEAI